MLYAIKNSQAFNDVKLFSREDYNILHDILDNVKRDIVGEQLAKRFSYLQDLMLVSDPAVGQQVFDLEAKVMHIWMGNKWIQVPDSAIKI